MDIKIKPSSLSGTIKAIPSKAFAHRLLIAAALADKPGLLHIGKLSEDIRATIRCIEAMGAVVSSEEDRLTIFPIPETRRPGLTLDCGESGSTARFLLPLAAHLFDSFEMTGRGKLPGRPFYPVCRALSDAGYEFDGDALPLSGRGKIQPGDFFIEGNISSQFISGLLFTLPLLDADSRIHITTSLESVAYIDMTIEVLRLFGIKTEKTESGFTVPGGQQYSSPGPLTVEGDWSNAAFFLCMGALSGPVSVTGLQPASTQGDKEIVGILKLFGADVSGLKDSRQAELIYRYTARQGVSAQENINIDASQIPDLVPALAVVASVSPGQTRIYNAGRLRLKESDRIQSTFDMLTALGADIRACGDELILTGRKQLQGGLVDGANDHRIVMAAATAASVCKNPVTIRGAEATGKSYPGFFEDYQSIGGEFIGIGSGK